MPKAADLDIDLSEPPQMPTAATAPRSVPKRAKQQDSARNDTPVNFRWPAAEVKAMKRAALDADMTQQEFLLTCFHAYLHARK
jgi:hypothetical protein